MHVGRASDPEPCGEHRQICADPMVPFMEAATHLKLIGDAFRCIETRQQLHDLKDLLRRHIAEARRALAVAEFALGAESEPTPDSRST